MQANGIDVSKYQGKIDWATVKASGKADFAIVRAGYGRAINQIDPYQIDPFFADNYKGCKAVGMPVGAYWYSYATDVESARKEAKTCLKAIKDKQFEFPVWFDQEYEPRIKALTNQQRTDIVKAFCEALEAAGYYTGLYCSRDWLQNYLIPSQLKAYDVWVAAYGSDPGAVPLPFGMWQHTSSGRVPGISGNVDLDIAYKDYPAIIKGAHLNGF